MAKSMSKNAIFKAMLNLFNIILPILVMPLVSRSFGDKLYGYYGYGDSLTAYFLIFASFGIYQYGLREISKVRDDKIKLRQTFTSLLIFTTITNIVASASYMIYVAICYEDQPYFYTCIILGFNIVFNTFYVEWVNEAMENYDFIDNYKISNFSKLKSFASGLSKDKEAVENAVMLPYSNGFIEGNNNRLKMIKRTMYGRAGLDLLRAKVIL